jgi:thioesterase domain-containing protein
MLRAAQGRLVITNAYGPTEAIVVATRQDLTDAEDARDPVPIGSPEHGTAVHLLDSRLRPVPLGAAGELWISGPLARGYIGRPAETAAAFRPDPFSAEPGARMYRTGDFARRLADGRLVFLGRRDEQVKVRGFRVELGEIEAALRRIPGVREGVVTVRDDGAGRYLAAYVVPADGAGLDEEAVRSTLREGVPEFMVPGAVVVLAALARTASGKIDRRGLPAPRQASRSARVAPRDDLERALAAVWCETLGIAEADVEESFFEAGGNSLLAIRFVARVRRVLGSEAPVAALFREPTLAGFARWLRAERGGEGPAAGESTRLVTLRTGSGLPPLVCFPAAAGGISDFAALGELLDPRRPIYAVQVLDSAPSGTPSIEQLGSAWSAAVARAVPDGPVHLLGWSWGGLAAFEVARRLRESGREVGALFLIDAAVPGAIEARSGEDQGLRWVVDPDGEDLDPAEVERWMAGVADRMAVARKYRPSPYGGSAVVVRGTESNLGRTAEATLGWADVVQGDLALEWAPGSHESILGGEGGRAVAAIVERYAQASLELER